MVREGPRRRRAVARANEATAIVRGSRLRDVQERRRKPGGAWRAAQADLRRTGPVACTMPVPSSHRMRNPAGCRAATPHSSCSGNSASASTKASIAASSFFDDHRFPPSCYVENRQHCTKKAPPESGAKFATLGSLPYSAADAGEVTDALVGALPDALFQLRPRLPGVPALLKLRLGLIQGRHARDRTVDGQRDRNHLIFFWAAAGLIDKCSIKCINRVASCSTGPRSRGHLPGSGLP